MRKIKLTHLEIDVLDTEDVVVSLWSGDDDIITLSGKEILAYLSKNYVMSLTLSDAIKYYLKDVNRNSYTIMMVKNGKIHELSM